MSPNAGSTGTMMTVTGPISSAEMGFTLPHEHIMSNFGADPSWQAAYPVGELLGVVLPYLEKLRKLGCKTILDCTTAYFGRSPTLLKRISEESGMQLVTNTGYYAAASRRYVPEHAYQESVARIAERWIDEWVEGIDGTGVRPGFIKTAVGDGPLLEISQKLIEAAILTHKATGLTIQTHLGDNAGAGQQILDLLAAEGVDPSAWVWVHAHSMTTTQPLLEAANMGAWISFDGINEASAGGILDRLVEFKTAGQLGQVLLSHDGDSYNLGNFRPYDYLLTGFIRQCLEAGFTQVELDRLTVENPANAFAASVKLVE